MPVSATVTAKAIINLQPNLESNIDLTSSRFQFLNI
jgi:hypothetical protein